MRVLDFGVEEGTPYFVMNYAPNGSLRQQYPRGTRLPLETIVAYVKQVADAIEYAHQRTLIHGDIKPENMLLGTNREVLLSDFGVATLGQSSRNRDIEPAVGTIYYMAPEQIRGKPQLASDQYALGVVVYEWLCGECPFSGSFTEVATQHLFTPPPSLREKVPMLPSTVEEVVLRALDKDPQQRFASIQAFATAFETACQSAPSFPSLPAELLTVDTPVQQEPAEQSRHISRRTVVIAGGLAGVAVVGGGFWLARSFLHPLGPAAHLAASATPPVASATPPVSSPTPPAGPTLGTLFYTYHGHSDRVYGVAWSPDGKRIASGSYDQTVQVWDASDGGNVFTYRGNSSRVLAVAWSPDGRRIASGSYNLIVQVWDASNGGNVFTYRGHNSSVFSVAWSPDGRRIASGGYEGTAQVWDASDGGNALIYRGHSDKVWAVAWSPDGKRIASGSGDRTVQVWDATSGATLFTYHGHNSSVFSVAWSPDGKRIASGGYEGTVQVWDASDGGNSFTYSHGGQVRAVAWSPDGRRIASGGVDSTVQVWDASDGGNAFIYRGHSDFVETVAWSPDGKRIASGSFDGVVQVWQGE